MKTQLKVIKADGTVENYVHTKVFASLCSAMSCTDQLDTEIAENLADVVTYYLYQNKTQLKVFSEEIFSIIVAVLASADYEEAALAIDEHRRIRKLKRNRVEVIKIDLEGHENDTRKLAEVYHSLHRDPWNKSEISRDLFEKWGLERDVARTVATMVEEKILDLQMKLVPSSLVKHFVLAQTASMLKTDNSLQTA